MGNGKEWLPVEPAGQPVTTTHPAPETQQPSKIMSIIRALLAAGLTLGLSTLAAATGMFL